MNQANGNWHPDPRGRYEKRWHDGAQWTAHVSSGGQTMTDPLGVGPTPGGVSPTPPPPPFSGAAPAAPYPGAAPGVVVANTGQIVIAGTTYKLGTIGERLLARIIDFVVYAIVWFLVIVLAFSALASSDGSGAGIAGFFFAMFILFTFGLLYEWLMIAFYGATLGKMAMSIRVVSQEDAGKIGFGPAFIRQLIPAVGAWVCYIGAILVYLSPLFDGSGRMQGWHDKAANNLVIKAKVGT